MLGRDTQNTIFHRQHHPASIIRIAKGKYAIFLIAGILAVIAVAITANIEQRHLHRPYTFTEWKDVIFPLIWICIIPILYWISHKQYCHWAAVLKKNPFGYDLTSNVMKGLSNEKFKKIRWMAWAAITGNVVVFAFMSPRTADYDRGDNWFSYQGELTWTGILFNILIWFVWLDVISYVLSWLGTYRILKAKIAGSNALRLWDPDRFGGFGEVVAVILSPAYLTVSIPLIFLIAAISNHFTGWRRIDSAIAAANFTMQLVVMIITVIIPLLASGLWERWAAARSRLIRTLAEPLDHTQGEPFRQCLESVYLLEKEIPRYPLGHTIRVITGLNAILSTLGPIIGYFIGWR